MSYGGCELDLSGLSLCSIIGGNGSGKSTIIESILWALYGTAKLPNKELVHSGYEDMGVDLTFEMDGRTYQIERSYGENMRVTVQVDGQPIASGNAAIALALNKAIGANKEMLMESIVVSQGQLGSFINATPAQRRDLIISMLGLSKYSGAWDTAKDGLRTMATQVSSHNQTIDTIKRQIEQGSTDEEITQQIIGLRKGIEEGTKKFEELTKQRAKILAENEQTAKDMERYKEEARALSDKLNSSKTKFDHEIQRLVLALSESDKQTNSLEFMKSDIIRLEREIEESRVGIERLKVLRQKIADYEERVKQRREYTKLIDAGKNECPLCRSKISNEQWQEILRMAHEEMAELVRVLDMTSREAMQVLVPGDPNKLKQDMEDRRLGISKAETLLGSRKILSDQLDELRIQREKTTEELNAQLAGLLKSLEECRGRMAATLGTLESDINAVQNQQMERSDQLIGWTSMQASREMLRKSLEDAEHNLKLYRDKLPEMEFVVAALSPSGIPLMITDYYLPVIESRARELLQMMSDGQITLKLEVVDAGTKKGVEILAGSSHLRPIKSLSGGESTRVSLALRIALSQILAEIANCRFNSLIVDEPEFLDEVGVSQFIQAINSLRSQYPQIFVMSHLSQIKSAFPQYISVEKTDNISTAKVFA